jgi:hypothetical protein
MKNLTITLLFAALGLFAFLPTAKKSASPLNGAWELYSTEKGGKMTFHNKPSQIKVNNDGNFCLVAFDSTGKFSYGCAGTYELDGNHYKETFTYHTYPKFVDTSIWFDWEMKGDTLIFAGFKKVIMADGKDITKDWGGDSFINKMVRVKK